jgi:hypothetical protein
LAAGEPRPRACSAAEGVKAPARHGRLYGLWARGRGAWGAALRSGEPRHAPELILPCPQDLDQFQGTARSTVVQNQPHDEVG